MKGRRVPIVVAEQGIGRGSEPLTSLLNLFADGAGGDWYVLSVFINTHISIQIFAGLQHMHQNQFMLPTIIIQW